MYLAVNISFSKFTSGIPYCKSALEQQDQKVASIFYLINPERSDLYFLKGDLKYDDDSKNYRVILLLAIITKLMERLPLNRLKGGCHSVISNFHL